MALRAILFDLDGTLVQTRETSWELFQETNRAFSLGIADREAFFALFKENFFRSLATVCGDPVKLAAVKSHFIDLLRTRYAPPLVPGLADVVRALAGRFTLVVLSTNTIAAIRRILTEAGLSHCFAHVFAGDVEPDKSASMRRFLADVGYGLGRRCSPEYDEQTGPGTGDGEVVLVTDTVGDVKEARASGVRAIGVAWGMHSEEELLAAGAEMVAIWPQELIAWLSAEGAAHDAPDASHACACGPAPNACAVATSAPCTCHGVQNPSGAAEPNVVAERVLAAARVRRARRSEPAPRAAPARPVTIHAPPPGDDDLLAALRRLNPCPDPRTRVLEAS